MKWDDVQILLAVVDTGSLTGAAEALELNHSTVYRRLTAFEQALGVRLFDRDGGRYTLTEAGQAALPHARDAGDAMAAFRRIVEGHDRRPSGVVRLTAPESLLRVLSPHLGPFRVEHPEIDLRVTFADRFFDLGKQEADVALRPTPRPPEDLHGRRIAAIAWAVYAPADSPPDLELPWGTYADELADLDAARWRRRTHPDAPTLLSVNTVPAMQSVICAAGCQGLLPCFVGDVDPTLRRVAPPIPEAESALWLLVHPDLRHTARVRALLDHLWAAMRSDVDRLEGRLGGL